MCLNILSCVATDQSHHYRAIIEMLKTEKPDGENEDDILLDRFLLPAVTDGSVTSQQVGCVLVQGEKHFSEYL